MEKLLCISLVFLSLVISFSEAELGIFGGNPVDIRDAPYQAAYYSRGLFECGATILGEKCVLTSGYCATTYHDNVTIKVGSNLRNAGGTIVKIDQIILHPDFQIESLSNDFAILVPNVKLVFSESVQPIKILCHCKPLLDGTPCNVTGWGLSERRVFPVHLRSTDIFVVNQDICEENYSHDDAHYQIDDGVLCAGVPGGKKDSCFGDGGGPLVCEGKLAGIVSTGFGCGYKDYPGIYSKVSKIQRWVRTVCGIQ